MDQGNVLIIADEADFARSLMGRWQMERTVPAFTLVSSELWSGAEAGGCHLAIVGPVAGGQLPAILRALESASVCGLVLVDDAQTLQKVRDEHSRLAALRRHDGWTEAAVLLGCEMLRRLELAGRAQQAEHAAAAAHRHATLGRYVLEMRHSFNNALTSVLGNAELLLLEPGALTSQVRDQIRTMHSMAMRMHEIMQRFSSLETEMRFAEKQSHSETQNESQALVQSR